MRQEVIERIQTKKIITIVRGVYGEDICRLARARRHISSPYTPRTMVMIFLV